MATTTTTPPQQPPALPQGRTSLLHQHTGPSFYLAQFKTPQLAIFSYYIESENQAYLIDPTLDIYPYQQLAEKRKSKIIGILLTHYHADYVAGHTEMDLPIIMGPKSKRQGTKAKIYQMQDEATFDLGGVWIKVLHTPGHTLESSCFLLKDGQKKQACLLTGDTIFLGQVGRPDLAVSSSITKQQLAAMLFKSIQKIKKSVNHSVRIYPTHGSGSACGKNIGQGNFCTLQTQLKKNYALQIQNQEQFITKILTQMPKPPSYFFHDAKLNQTSHAPHFKPLLSKSLHSLSIAEYKKQIQQGCIVIDSRQNFGGKSIKGSYLMSENGVVASWVGMLIKPQAAILLFCEGDKAKVEEMVERLLRIGYFGIKGYNGFTIQQWESAGLPITKYKSINALQFGKLNPETTTYLDVRNPPQYKSTSIIQNSKLIPLPNIPQSIQTLKPLQNIYINCRTGARARLAASILASSGLESTIVAEKFEEFQKNGIKMQKYIEK